MKPKKFEALAAILSVAVFAGCSQTYPAEKVKESIQEICRKEYGIENVQVKIAGRTVGVFLPVKKLFVTDFKEALLSSGGKITESDSFLQPSPEALNQVEDTLFSISRVLLSTDLKLQFYLLQATDVEKTGLSLVLTGFVDDIKRVRLWDISRDEYRKRILHELKLNHAAIWNRPVRNFFQTLEKATSIEEFEDLFPRPLTLAEFKSLFLVDLRKAGSQIRWNVGEVRSISFEPAKVIVYAPVKVEYQADRLPAGSIQIPSGSLLEYFFIVSFESDRPKIIKIIPLFFLDETGKIQKISVPAEIEIEKDMESWETEFRLSEIQLGEFLAEQLTRRTQNLLYMDERIQNTFESIRSKFYYHKADPDRFFSFELDVKLRTSTPWAQLPTALHEDVIYLLNLVSREFVNTLRSYRFSDYKFLQFNFAFDPVSRVLGKEELELFRRNKVDLQGILSGVTPLY